MTFSSLRHFLTLLFAVISINAFAKNTQKVILHFNGYKGNIAYRTGAPTFLEYHYFYVSNPKGDTVIELEGTADELYYFDNGAYLDSSAFSFYKKDGHIISQSSTESVDFKVIKDKNGNDSIPVFTFKTCTIKVKTNGLTSPYMFSPFALIKGQSSTNGASFNYVTGDMTVTLIKDMRYTLDNGGLNVIFMHDGMGDEADTTVTAIPFKVDKNGFVKTSLPGAAIGIGNTLSFNTSTVTVDPFIITGQSNISVRIPNGNGGNRYITKPTKVTVFKYLANMIFWNDAGNHLRTFFFREL